MPQFADRLEGVTGSEIRKIFSLLQDPEIISLAGGNPCPTLFPGKELAEISNYLIQNEGAWVLQYGGTMGVPAFLSFLKEQNAAVMKADDDLIVTSGSSQGIELFTRALLNEGDAMLVESPTFLGALQTFKLARAKVGMVEMEEDGADLADLERKVKEFNPKFFYVIPTFQNPSGITTSAQKRRGIYDICKAHGVMVLEDDPYAELRYEGAPLPSIKSLDEGGLVCRLSSFSKTISPGLRVGYAVAHRDVIGKFNLLKQGQDVHTSNLSQAMVMEFVKRGYYEKHVAMLCREYKIKRDAMLDALQTEMPDTVHWTRPMGGLFVWVTLPRGVDAGGFFEECVACKVAYVPGSPFFADGGHRNTLRLNFSMPSVDEIREGVARLGRLVRRECAL